VEYSSCFGNKSQVFQTWMLEIERVVLEDPDYKMV